jgi:hypothetical protein
MISVMCYRTHRKALLQEHAPARFCELGRMAFITGPLILYVDLFAANRRQSCVGSKPCGQASASFVAVVEMHFTKRPVDVLVSSSTWDCVHFPFVIKWGCIYLHGLHLGLLRCMLCEASG